MKIRTSLKAIMVLAGALFLLVYPISSKATTLTFDYNFEFSAGTDPAGPAPWLRATFNDEINQGKVRLTMSTMGLTGSEFTSIWVFNLNPNLTAASLGIAAIDITDSNPIVFTTGTDFYKADGDGYYDIKFDFPNSANDNRFTAGEEVIIDITYSGVGTFNANSFNFMSSPGGGAGTFLAATHVQGIGTGAQFSGWVAPGPDHQVPEPGILILLGIGMTAAGVASRWIRKI